MTNQYEEFVKRITRAQVIDILKQRDSLLEKLSDLKAENKRLKLNHGIAWISVKDINKKPPKRFWAIDICQKTPAIQTCYYEEGMNCPIIVKSQAAFFPTHWAEIVLPEE